ncbi:MAG: FGGY-family carbohydrate kinase, partial [Clostridia bacterium]|nr:FGGY-family carbohydrate kinase [Clostridia bacterium]
LLTTIAWGVNGEVTYAIEGSIFNAGSSIQWLRDELHLIESASETNEIASSVPDTAGVYVVPAFTGLGAPYWDMNARGAIVGITRGANRSHLVRATLESMAYGTKDILENMRRDSAITLKELRVDGGVARNDFLMQFQADMLNCNIIRPTSIETTALGVVYLAGLATGAFKDLKHLEETIAFDRVFKPDMAEEVRKKKYAGWKKAVKRALAWED